MSKPITAMDVALSRLAARGRVVDERISGEDFDDVRIPMFGGCYRCAASIAAYNAFPGRNGFWHCDDCIGDDEQHVGYDSVEDFERDERRLDEPSLADKADAAEELERAYPDREWQYK